ncbi:peroxidase [Calliphora vicina]|uniref:peroxidase n=1 Tax=Calliphora vicina TaxID=7373 RepID=UPI00325A9EFB
MSIKHLSVVIFIAINIFCRTIFVGGFVQFKFDPIVISKFEFDTINSITPHEWLDFAKRGCESNEQEKSLETNLVASNVVVQNGTISHSQLLDTLPSVEAQKDSEVADEILKASLYIYNSKCAPQSISGEHCETILSDIDLPKDSELAHKCQSIVNGRNNGDYALRRLLPRHYKDGFYKMFSDILPQPLAISHALGGNPTKEKREFLDDFQRNLAVVQWSQFVANDLNKPVVTTMSNGSPIECCNIQNYKLSPRYHHPACEPLISKDNANRYGPDTCLNYVRSALAVGHRCTFAAPEQLNQGTAKLDLSQLYGFNEKSQNRMRLKQKGLLKSTSLGKSQDSLLPMAEEDTNWFCALIPDGGSNSTCFMAGDSRVNSDPFAIIIHTIMMRNHNRIAKELNIQHPDWNDDQLFQKAKSINIDIYHRIVIDEWLPVVLGTSMTNEIKMIKSRSVNNESLHQISNEYAIAASRFYLSMMPNELRNYAMDTGSEYSKDESSNKIDTNIFILKDEIYSPSIEYTSNKLDQILYSVLMQQAMKLDASYVESLSSDLANNKRPTHSDLLAFDIQRGRDHGLQPYFKYLEICNNVKINNWKDLQTFIKPEDLSKLKNAYSNWRDIDLIVGGISEMSARNATVGPTFQCIIGEQFSKLKQWHQSEIDQTDLDLSKWKTTSAADLLCLNSNLQRVPLNIFKISSKTNPLVECSEHLKSK